MLKLFTECFEDMHRGVVFGVTVIAEVVILLSEKVTKIITGKR